MIIEIMLAHKEHIPFLFRVPGRRGSRRYHLVNIGTLIPQNFFVSVQNTPLRMDLIPVPRLNIRGQQLGGLWSSRA